MVSTFNACFFSLVAALLDLSKRMTLHLGSIRDLTFEFQLKQRSQSFIHARWLTKDIKILPAISECRQDVSVDLPVFEVFRINQDDAVDGIDVTDMVDKIPSTEVHRDLPVGRPFLEHPAIVIRRSANTTHSSTPTAESKQQTLFWGYYWRLVVYFCKNNSSFHHHCPHQIVPPFFYSPVLITQAHPEDRQGQVVQLKLLFAGEKPWSWIAKCPPFI